MAHLHSVYDTDAHFLIDAVSRTIRSEAPKKTTVVQYDHNSERFTFELPRYIEGHDMSTCNKVEVHFLNVSTSTAEKAQGVYEVEDLQISEDDEGVVIFSWLLSGNATRFAGQLSFLIRFCCLTDDVVDYVWNTTVYSSFYVAAGMYASDSVVAEYSDTLERWKASLFAAGYINAEDMQRDIANLNTDLATERSRIDLLSNYVTPQMFGAKGDGVTDDTAAFKLAIDHVVTNAWGDGWKSVPKIFVPHGTYLVSEALLADQKYGGYKFIFEGSGYTNTTIKVSADCPVLFPNNDIYGFTTFSDIEFIGADNTQTFMEVLSGATGNAQSIYFYRCAFRKFHTVLKLGKVEGVTTGTMTSETLFSGCKINGCGNADNPCELFVLDNQQSVNNRFYATDIEGFVGVLFKYKEGNAITFYQGSIIPLSGSTIVDGTELDGNTSSGGNQPSLTMWGCRFELRGNTKLLKHGPNFGRLALSFNECGMGCTNLDDGVIPISIHHTASADIYFTRCRNAGRLYCEFDNLNSSTNRSTIRSKVHFVECDMNVKNFVENSTLTIAGNNTYVAHPEIKVDGVHYNLDKTVKNAPLGKHLRVVEKCLLDGVNYNGFDCGYTDHPKTHTVDVCSYIKEITLTNIGNSTFQYYPGNKLSCAIYNEDETLLGNINGISVASGSGSLQVNKYAKTLKLVFSTDLAINAVLPVIAMAKIIG